jgi:hypothetical protein
VRRLLVKTSVVPSSPIFVTRWRRRQVPPKSRFLQEPHGVTSQKAPFFIVTTANTSIHPLMVLWNYLARYSGYILWSFLTSFDWWNSSLVSRLLWPVLRSLYLLSWSAISSWQTGGRCAMLDLSQTKDICHHFESILLINFEYFCVWCVAVS